MKGFDKEYIKQAVDWTNEAGIFAAGSFILGFPGKPKKLQWKQQNIQKLFTTCLLEDS